MNSTVGAAPPAAVSALRSRPRGRVIVPTEAGYDGVRRVWNCAVDRRPDLIARVRAAYGPNLDRLLALRRRYDPDRVLSAVPTLPG